MSKSNDHPSLTEKKTSVPSDGGFLGMATAPAAAPVYLSCGHLRPGYPGEQVWCTGCDDWAVAGKAGTKKFSLFGINLSQADLRTANLEGANLRGARLEAADLTRARLEAADLTRANLRGARLTEADLTRANLRGARLTEADLTGANLRGARLTEADLSNCTYNDQTKWPEGFMPPRKKD